MSTYEGLWPLCETCGAVPTSHRDYRDCEAHMRVVAHAYNAGRENGCKQERAAVVAWLREDDAKDSSRNHATTAWLREDDAKDSSAEEHAVWIEHGAHRREEKT